jgi:hypothetical protein
MTGNYKDKILAARSNNLLIALPDIETVSWRVSYYFPVRSTCII